MYCLETYETRWQADKLKGCCTFWTSKSTRTTSVSCACSAVALTTYVSSSAISWSWSCWRVVTCCDCHESLHLLSLLLTNIGATCSLPSPDLFSLCIILHFFLDGCCSDVSSRWEKSCCGCKKWREKTPTTQLWIMVRTSFGNEHNHVYQFI